MDWITFIKWNGIVYATNYGANLLVDYLRTTGELKSNPSFTEYQSTHQLFENILKILGADHTLQKQDIFARKSFVPIEEEDFLSRKYVHQFENRKYTEITTYLTITKNVRRTMFFNYDEQRMNSIPGIVNNMFKNEWGIDLGYNSKTGMAYYKGDSKTDNKISKSARKKILGALEDNVGGEKAKDKYGEVIFGNGGAFGNAPYSVFVGLSHRASMTLWIDLADFNEDGTVKAFDYTFLKKSGVSARTYNIGRIFEHEWSGHLMHKAGDGLFWNTRPGGAVSIVNSYRREMGLAERLNYGGHNSYGIYFSQDTSRKNQRAIRRKAKRGLIAPYIPL
jgi:hypothetical protein